MLHNILWRKAVRKFQKLLTLVEGSSPSSQASMYFSFLRDKLNFTNFSIEGSKVKFYDKYDKTKFKLTFGFSIDEDGEVSLNSAEIPSARGKDKVITFGKNKAKSELEIEKFMDKEFGDDIRLSLGRYRSELLADKIIEYSESRGMDIQERLLEELEEIDFFKSGAKYGTGEKSAISNIDPESVECKVLSIGEALEIGYNSLSNLKYNAEKYGRLAPAIVSLKFKKDEEASTVFEVLKKANSSEITLALLGSSEDRSYIDVKLQSAYDRVDIILYYSDLK